MKIKTCEEYVLQRLNNAEEKIAELQAESEFLHQGWNELQKDHKELLDKYDKLRQSLYNSLEEVARPKLSYLQFKVYTSCLYNDNPNYPVIKEAIDSYAREVGETDKGEPR